jgi:hypothetical protein
MTLVLVAALAAPFLSIGENPGSREVISYFPEERICLERAYAEFRERIVDPVSPRDLLEDLCLFVREKVFDLRLCREAQVAQIVNGRTRVPLDEFIYAKTGVCRHFCLVVDYFLEQLIEEKLLVGQSERIRLWTPGKGKHAWNLLHTPEGCFYLDAYWGNVGNSNDKTDRDKYLIIYGHDQKTN